MPDDIGPDPNEGSTDPMVEEFWHMGEAVQDRIRFAGYESERVEGIAVDIHDLLQSAEIIRAEIAPALASAPDGDVAERLRELKRHLEHIRWHTLAAQVHIDAALAVMEP